MDLKRIQVSVYTAFDCRCGDVKQLPYLSPFKPTQIMQIGEKPRLHIVDAAYHLPGRCFRFRQIYFKGSDFFRNELRVLALDPACLDYGQQLPGGIQFLQFFVSLRKYSRYDFFPLPLDPFETLQGLVFELGRVRLEYVCDFLPFPAG